MPPTPSEGALRAYFTFYYIAVLAMIAMFWRFAEIESLSAVVLTGVASASYAALFALPPLGLTGLAGWLLRKAGIRSFWRWSIVYLTAWMSSTLVLLILYADYRLYELYEYHFNGFVWNLITTPGGVAALGATDATMATAAFHAVLFFVGTAVVLWAAHRATPFHNLVSRRLVRIVAGILMASFVSQEGIYAYSIHTGQEDYLEAVDVVPLHLHTSATGVFNRLGVKRTALTNLRVAGGEVDYPAKNLASRPLETYPNIIMLVGESFRWDLLDPEITPNLWKFSNESLRFDRHYSGGNRTRMGLFSMFYGIHAPYWYSFERQRVAPAFMNFLREKDYQLALHTSQSFNYPELRHTVFSGVPEKDMQELQSGEPWKRDSQNISDLIGKLERRDPKRPFYGFMFFESTHAPYTFPEEAVVRRDYQKEMNYVGMDLQRDIESIRARYINAAHHVDREAGRLIDHLRQKGMLENTIVLFTGDHGEEFMEKGHWGHGHNKVFPEEQIRVPLVLWMPGQKPGAVTHRTSHLQIAPTLLERLGVTQNSRTYSSADNLFSQLPYFVSGNYDYMTVFDSDHKITFPFTGSDFFRYAVHDSNDRPLTREARTRVIEQHQARIDEALGESRRFIRR